MTSEPPISDPHSSDGGDRPTVLSPARALAVLAVFVVAVIVLVNVGTRPSVSGETAPTATTTTVASSSSTTTSSTVPHSSVTVLVANATEQAALAAHYSTILTGQGWAVKTPTDATTHSLSTSAVYYAAGQKGPATTIATSLGLKSTAVLPLTTAVPVAGATGNDVVVVIGANLVTQAG
ncbi:MAG TPA: LytR C-terminal domain-containing protein [Acidimicrobiales bacterium]|jgi:hypothetical protein